MPKFKTKRFPFEDTRNRNAAERRVALHVAANNPSPPILPRPPRSRSDRTAIILPPIDPQKVFPTEVMYSAMGIKRKQSNLAYQVVMQAREEDEVPRLIHCLDRLLDAKREVAFALEEMRRETLTILMEHYPAAARRIMRGYARRQP